MLQLISEGNELSFRRLYDYYSEMVYNTAMGFVGDVKYAEEITQDVFTKAYRNAGSFKGNSSVKTWLYRITVNTSLNQINKNKRHRYSGLEDIEKIEYDHPGILLENKENAKTLQLAINALAETQKTAFVLSFVEGLPRQEVADIMETSLKAVESLLQRAKGNLRTKLEKMYPYRRKK